LEACRHEFVSNDIVFVCTIERTQNSKFNGLRIHFRRRIWAKIRSPFHFTAFLVDYPDASFAPPEGHSQAPTSITKNKNVKEVKHCLPSTLDIGWLRLVGSLKVKVSIAKEPYKRDDILQKRPKILRSLLIAATPYVLMTLIPACSLFLVFFYVCSFYFFL